MARFWMMVLTLLLTACATGPAAVRVTFDAHAVTSVRAVGYADRATRRRVTADDPVRVASVSKLIVALGVMRLVEAGKLDLDADVSTNLGWPLRNPNFPSIPITLRMILSHTSSLRDGIDYAIPLGLRVKDALRNPRAWDDTHPPGTYFSYANLNFPVAASVMEAVTQERFDFLMARLVFVPLGLDACFNWTSCTDDAVAHAVVLYDDKGVVLRDDLHGRRPACPVLAPTDCDLGIWSYGTNGALFSPQGGARISADDLARIGQVLMANGGDFLSPASVAALEAPQWRFDGSNGDTQGGVICAYGLAVQTLATGVAGCRDDPAGDSRPRIGHAGEAYGVRSGLWIDRAAGTGVAFFATAIPETALSGRRSAFTRVEERAFGGHHSPLVPRARRLVE